MKTLSFIISFTFARPFFTEQVDVIAVRITKLQDDWAPANEFSQDLRLKLLSDKKSVLQESIYQFTHPDKVPDKYVSKHGK